MTEREYHFAIWQGGIVVAEGYGPDRDVLGRDMVHYAMQYVQDGPITITGSPELAPQKGADVSRVDGERVQEK